MRMTFLILVHLDSFYDMYSGVVKKPKLFFNIIKNIFLIAVFLITNFENPRKRLPRHIISTSCHANNLFKT